MTKALQTFVEGAKGLSRNPLGIIALFIVLIYAMAATLTWMLDREERQPLIYFLVLFPLPVLGVFGWLVSRHGGKLYAPSDFRSEENYLRAQHPPAPPSAQHVEEKPAPPPSSSPPREEEAAPVERTSEPTNPRMVMISAFFDGRIQDAEASYRSLLATETDSDARIRLESTYLALRYRYASDNSAIPKLKALAHASPDSRSEILAWVASSHQFARDFDAAETSYREAVETATTENERARRVVSLVECLGERGSLSVAIDLASEKLRDLLDPVNRAIVYKAIADIEKIAGNALMRAIALEKALEATPESAEALFAAAYAESECELSPTVLENYDTLLRFEPKNGLAANNLAVELERLEMPIRSVGLYRRAVVEGNTLAMANLAYRFMNQGFSEEAREILKKAGQEADPHVNVSRATAALAERIEAEDKRWDSLVALSTAQRQFIRAYAESYYVPTEDVKISGSWLKGQTAVLIEQTNAGLTATWSEQGVKHHLSGVLRNRSARVQMRKWERSLLLLSDDGGSWGSETEGLAYCDASTQQIFAMLLKDDEVEYFTLNRSSGPPTQNL